MIFIEFFLTSILISELIVSNAIINDPDSGKTIRELVEGKGFQLEEYSLQSGIYLINFHRVLKPSRCHNDDPRKIVVFGQPLGGVSDLWVLDFPNNSWGNCFDVWLANCRGTGYGNRYANGTEVSHEDHEFYDFTFIDIGAEDMTAQVDFILKKTGQEKVFWFGMSQGAFVGFAMLAKKPEYNKKIRAFAGLGGSRSLCSSLMRFMPWIPLLTNEVRVHIPGRSNNTMVHAQFCAASQIVCTMFRLLLDGRFVDSTYANGSRAAIYFEHFPHGTSLKNLLYYSQLVTSCDGGQYDFDEDRYNDNKKLLKENPQKYSLNIRKYGTLRPPRIPNSRITVPVKLYTSSGDYVVPAKDVERLAKLLPNCVGVWHIKDKRWTHMTFAMPAMYPPIFKDVREFYESFL